MINKKTITLSENDVGCLKYFINRYAKSHREGNLKEAHHDAVAVVLILAELLGVVEGGE